MEQYRFQPLPTANHIRLITIHPGRFDDDIVVSLDPITLTQDTPSHYEALSYVWDKEQNPRPIYVGKHERSAISVTRNLTIALDHLRYPDKPRVMWIDALCIDQSSDIEKGSQVALMGKIYRFATQVVAWFGLEQDNSTRAL
ncbi:heterokaryon incompatibility protein-domain-containing protein, partial [Ilyonectria sp. MPI-CAGE-AT-0026]